MPAAFMKTPDKSPGKYEEEAAFTFPKERTILRLQRRPGAAAKKRKAACRLFPAGRFLQFG